jgi:hypothetical protein
MAEDRQSLAVKEVQNPIIHVALAYAKLVDSIPEQIGQRSSQLMAKRSEAFEPRHTLLIRRRILASDFAQPIKNRDVIRALLVENHNGARSLLLDSITIL